MYLPNLLWNFVFCLGFNPKNKNKVVVTGAVGGNGKTTVSELVNKTNGNKIISIDKCKYGPNWTLYSNDQFEENFKDQLYQLYDHYVIDGYYHDIRIQRQKTLLDEIMNECDMTIWNDVPRIIVFWRICLRSFKRRIGVSKGHYKESLKNIRRMLWKTWYSYNLRYNHLNQKWNRHKNDKRFLRAKWPYYYGKIKK